MSIKVTTLVWERSQATGSALLLLLKIADNCHDDGAGAHPGIAYLAKRARMSERNIQYNLRKLEALGELEIQRAAGRYGQNHYRVNVALLKGRPDTDESDTQTLHPSGVEAQTSVSNGANQGISGAQPIAPKPSIEPLEQPLVNISRAIPAKRHTYTPEFEGFWSQYPQTYGKEDAFKAWKRIDPEDWPNVLAGLNAWKKCQRWQEGYVKGCVPWLRDRWWAETPPTTRKPTQTTRTRPDFAAMAQRLRDQEQEGRNEWT